MRSIEKQSKEQGFTLVELLVAMTILGVILVIALPRIGSIQRDYQKTKYKKYADSLKIAGDLYTDSYAKDMFGNNMSGCYDIPYSKLKQRNLAKDIKVEGANCNTYGSDNKTELTYIRVLKSNENYSYEVAIKCINEDGGVLYNKTISDEVICDGTKADESGPGIIFAPDGHDWYKGLENGNPDQAIIKISDQYGMTEDTTIQYAWLKDGEDESSLTYQTKEFKNRRGAGKTSEPLEIAVEVPQNVTGEYTLIVKADNVRDANGLYMTSSTIKSGKFKLDNTEPTIPIIKNDKGGDWSTGPVDISATAQDEHSGVSKVYYDYAIKESEKLNNDWNAITPSGKNISVVKTWTTEINDAVYLIAVDKAGNQSKPILAGKIKVDNTKPTCTVTGGSTNWTKNNRALTINCNDGNGSGCKVKTSTDTITTTTRTKVYTVEDRLGQQGTCIADVYVDKTKPTCGTVTNSSTTWRNKKQTVTQACIDKDSGCKEDSYATEYDNKKTSGVYIADEVGNSTYCSYDVYVDTTPPYSPVADPTTANIKVKEGLADAYVIGASCSQNNSQSYDTNVCTADYHLVCKEGSETSNDCNVSYSIGSLKVDSSISGGAYYEYRKSKVGKECQTGLFSEWSKTYGVAPDPCETNQTITEYRMVDNAGNAGGILHVTYSFWKQ